MMDHDQRRKGEEIQERSKSKKYGTKVKRFLDGETI
jgi:hypothetical protein